MSAIAMNTTPDDKGRKLTGRAVLFMFIGFFSVFAIMNAIMVTSAIKTFRGLDADRPYESGIAFEKEMARAKAQNEMNWSVDIKVERNGDVTRVIGTPKDAAGKTLTGLTVNAIFAHPADRKRDTAFILTEQADGTYQGQTTVAPGRWALQFNADRDGKQTWRSVNHMTLK
jgi:nitrogen fixation protein FixH